MGKQIKVGLITNSGGAHVISYLSALKASDACGQVILADEEGRWGKAARGLGAKLSTIHRSWREMLDKGKPDLVLVTLEARLAPPVIDAALEAGCHVFAEKPSCVRLEDFEKLAFKAESRHLNLMLALANRLNPELRFARDLILAGRLGELYGIDLHLVADQTRLKGKSYPSTWFADPARSGGGHLIWLGIHWLDLAMHLTGSDISAVTGMTTNVGGQPVAIEDSAVATLRFDSGFLGTMTSGYYLDRGYHSGIKVWGSKGWLQLEQMADMPLQWYEAAGGQAGKIQAFTGQKQPRGYTPFVAAAVEACANESPPPITPAESLRALRTVFGIYESARSGRVVAL